MAMTVLFLVILMTIMHMAKLQNSQNMISGVRLVGGSESDGSVQVKVNGVWNFICDDDFGFLEADTICHDLGFMDAYYYSENDHYNSSTHEDTREGPQFVHLNCPSNISHSSDTALALSFCTFRTDNQHCERKEIAGIGCRDQSDEGSCLPGQYSCSSNAVICIPRENTCDGISNCPYESAYYRDNDNRTADEYMCGDVGVVRLGGEQQINSQTSRKHGGTVFIKHSGIWGTICDDNFGQEEAKVLCRNLGYQAGWAMAKEDAYFGRGSGKIWADNLLCTGSEGHIGDCPLISWEDTDCSHTEDAGLFCYDELESLRLVSTSGKVVAGGEETISTSTDTVTGRLELKMAGIWGPVCATSFDHKDAKVLCGMLGFSGQAQAHHNGEFGKGTGPLFDDWLDCFGNETDLRECSIRLGNCTMMDGRQRNHVAVTCSNRVNNVDILLRQRLPSDCGRTIDASNVFITSLAKVNNGVRKHRYASPWLVALVAQIPLNKDYRFFCGGVILSEDLVLTAAHCFRVQSPHNVKIRVGEYNRKFLDIGQQEFNIDKLWIHERFEDSSRNENDIALIKIQRIGPRGIRLGNSSPYWTSINLAGVPVVVVQYLHKWSTPHDVVHAEVEPLVGKINILPRHVCENFYSVNSTNFFTPDMICAGDLVNKVMTSS
ncbi:unnamed protein product, partial [Meganyctiphanes norvegica]